MSHIVTMQCQIKNIAALKEAVKVLGLEFREDQAEYTWWGGRDKCAHAIGHTSTRYEIGVVQKKAKDTFELKWDAFDNPIAHIIGYNAEQLTQQYAAQVVLQEVPFGWNYTQQKQENGDLLMEIYR